METIVLQDWTTVTGTGNTPFSQDAADWIEGTNFSDWTFWLDCNFVTPASSVVLTYETAPSDDDAQFQRAASISPVVASPTPAVARALLSRTQLAPIARFLRWKLQGPAAGTWSMTFRILAARGRAGGRAFEPPQLSGCALWLRSDIGITLNGANVSLWADQSGRGNDATPPTTSRQPAYDVVGHQLNGRPTIYFDPTGASGTEKVMYLPSGAFSSTTALHAFVVHRRVTATEGVGVRTGFWHLGNGPGTPAMPGTDGNIYDDCASTTAPNCGTPHVTLTTPQVYEVQSQAGSWATMLNGISQFSRASNVVSFVSQPQLGGNTAWPNYYYGDWAEVILYDRVLAAAERSLVVGYLNTLYDLGAQ